MSEEISQEISQEIKTISEQQKEKKDPEEIKEH